MWNLKVVRVGLNKKTSCQLVFPPEGFKPKLRAGACWCPYCGREFVFDWDDRLGVAHCPECKMTASDFHVRRVNGLGKNEALKVLVTAVKRRKKKRRVRKVESVEFDLFDLNNP